jgi:hypothetical protein
MAQECYLKWCYWHPKDEPICYQKTCKASDKELKFFNELRETELKMSINRAAKETCEEYYENETYLKNE